MTIRVVLAAVVLVLAIVAMRHPPAGPAFQSASQLPARPMPVTHSSGEARHARGPQAPAEGLVFVAGAVRRPGLYHVTAGDRAADAIARAGGQSATAQSGAVNLAAHVQDGDEVYVPAVGEQSSPSSAARRARYRAPRARVRGVRAPIPPAASVDVNAADEAALQAVPGIGRTIASRIVALRRLDGPYANLDELLDVAGMSQTRLDRARPFLRPP